MAFATINYHSQSLKKASSFNIVFPDEGKVLVEHVMMVKKHVRPNPQRNVKGGIAEQERRIALSNVALVCATCGPVRIGHEVRGDRKVRVCKKCGTTLDK